MIGRLLDILAQGHPFVNPSRTVGMGKGKPIHSPDDVVSLRPVDATSTRPAVCCSADPSLLL
jgi:hypothetical protein